MPPSTSYPSPFQPLYTSVGGGGGRGWGGGHTQVCQKVKFSVKNAQKGPKKNMSWQEIFDGRKNTAIKSTLL